MDQTEIIRNTAKEKAFKLFLGGFLLVFGIAFLQYYVGYVLWLFLIPVLTYQSGVEINFKKNSIRNYWSVFGKKKGEWKTLEFFNAIAIKRVKKGLRRYSSGLQSTDTFDTHYQVILFDRYKKARQFILFTSTDKTEIKYLANNWSIKLEVPLMEYNKLKER